MLFYYFYHSSIYFYFVIMFFDNIEILTLHNCISSITYIFKRLTPAMAGVAQWIECGLWTKGSPVQFPVRAHAWVASQVPSGGHMRGNHTLLFLSLSPSLPLSLKISK